MLFIVNLNNSFVRILGYALKLNNDVALPNTLTLSNPFFFANRILPSSYLFWAVKRSVDYL
jgi:hypothetical protein